MRSFTSLSFLTLLLASGLSTLVGAAAAVDEQCVSEMCLEASVLGHAVARSLEPTPVSLVRKSLTNAERLARGLPLKSPSRRHAGVAARAQTSPTPKYTVEGVIQVKKQDGTTVGYLNKATSSGGQFNTVTSTSSALRVSIELDTGATSGSGIDITMLNTAGPLLGLVQGRDDTTVDIASGSYQYLYLNGIALPGSGPNAVPMTMTNSYSTATGLSRAAESSVWNVDLTTSAMSVQWTNSDGSAPATKIFSQSGYMYAGGDPSAFLSRYPSPITLLNFYFVQDAVAPI